MLSDREEDVLLHLARLRFLTARHLAAFLYGSSRTTPRSRTVLTQRTLARLRQQGLVVMSARSVGGADWGERAPTYRLSSRGQLVSRTLLPDLKPRRSRSSGAILARHALATADVILAFARAARSSEDHVLVTWECDWQATLPLGTSSLEPDAYILYRAQGRRLHAFVEVDMGTESGGFVAAKMRRYLELHRSPIWRTRYPVWPLVLFVAITSSRVAQLRRLADGVSRTYGGWDAGASFRIAALEDVVGAEGPLGAIWQTLDANREPLIAPQDERGRGVAQ